MPHNGIDIATPAGAEVKSIYPGQVLYSAEFEGYGPMVVVHHPGRAFTLYAGLAELRVVKEDELQLGTVLGDRDGPPLLRDRIDNEPQDPIEWLR